jgi:RecA/RadA recombinase
MTALPPDVNAALASLRTRWGAAAPRRAADHHATDHRTTGDRTTDHRTTVGDVVGALATAPLPVPVDERPRPGTVVGTGFAELDAILGPGGVPRTASVAIRGAGSSGGTTLALRLAAEAQEAGSIVAWLDLARGFDPVEAVARGVRLEWLVVLTPETVDEGLAIAGTLLNGRTVDLLVVDLPARLEPGARQSRLGDRLHRLAAVARRAEALLVVLEPTGLASGLATAVAESTGLRLELARRSWIRLGGDVVGQRTEVTVARNRFGPPGRRAELRILYADGGERDACLRRDELLADAAPSTRAPATPSRKRDHATTPPLLAPPAARSRPLPPTLRVVDGAGGREPADRPRRPAVDRRDGHRPRSDRASPRHPPGDAARVGPPARTRGDVRRSGTGG